MIDYAMVLRFAAAVNVGDECDAVGVQMVVMPAHPVRRAISAYPSRLWILARRLRGGTTLESGKLDLRI